MKEASRRDAGPAIKSVRLGERALRGRFFQLAEAQNVIVERLSQQPHPRLPPVFQDYSPDPFP
jgi:hypothetical protein